MRVRSHAVSHFCFRCRGGVSRRILGLCRLPEPRPRLPVGQGPQTVAVDQPQLRRLFQRRQLFRVFVLADEVDPAIWQLAPHLDGDVAAGGNVLVLHALGEVSLQQQKVRLFGSTLPGHVTAVIREDADRPAAAQISQPVRRTAGHGGRGKAHRRFRQGRLPPPEEAHTAASRLAAPLGSRAPHSGQYRATLVTATPQPGQQRWRER